MKLGVYGRNALKINVISGLPNECGRLATGFSIYLYLGGKIQVQTDKTSN